MNKPKFALFWTLTARLMLPTRAVTVQEFASRPYVQRALKSPGQVESVLGFFFGVDYSQPTAEQELRQGTCMESMNNLWFQGGSDYDELCLPFRDTIRAAGRNEFLNQHENQQVDGLVAQMILCDQLARNVFRGTPEAFAYDDQALRASRRLTESVLQPTEMVLSGEIHPPYLSFMAVSLVHSESKKDHKQAMELLFHAKKTFGEHLQCRWDYQMQFEQEHKDVIDRFGRYPHRNKAKGRSSTIEEEAWLADTENLPAWAKSQL